MCKRLGDGVLVLPIGIFVSSTLIIAGCAFMLISVNNQFNNNYAETTGVIMNRTSCGQICSGNDSNQCIETFGAVIQYTVDYTNYTSNSKAMCTNPGPIVGNDIRVKYDPDNPQEIGGDSWSDQFLIPMILLGTGIFLLFLTMCKVAAKSELSGDPNKPMKVDEEMAMDMDLPREGKNLPLNIRLPATRSSTVTRSNIKPTFYSNTAPRFVLTFLQVCVKGSNNDQSEQSKSASIFDQLKLNIKRRQDCEANESTIPSYSIATPPIQVFPNPSNSDQSEPVTIFDQLKQNSKQHLDFVPNEHTIRSYAITTPPVQEFPTTSNSEESAQFEPESIFDKLKQKSKRRLDFEPNENTIRSFATVTSSSNSDQSEQSEPESIFDHLKQSSTRSLL